MKMKNLDNTNNSDNLTYISIILYTIFIKRKRKSCLQSKLLRAFIKYI